MTKSNKTIWITGASSGIGRSLALAYGQDSVNLILSAPHFAPPTRVPSMPCTVFSKAFVLITMMIIFM